ncbi:GNAT family N-acetyltransferase [Streptacidiphilus sp. ASG 303]|uniref:GNAT family N-acetyltransferase n=1 Tax=Streptacidiphilus sp. ASG 303 TaxID=2896847 RepID=UPI001E3C6BC7|nr:GNAT family N-acetyltransferase [Streptacidiphilus sp. ASG 303]MCD0483646.1 GNAT family N-acetyltransferase [Streptacidiphilus sp. ASG 303]
MSRVGPEEIRTGRLVLVPLRAEHADEMAGVLSDPALYAFTGGAPAAVPELRSRYARMIAGPSDPAVSWCNWVLLLREEGCLTGTVQATVTEDGGDGAGRTAEVAWVVGTPWQGRGIATEAARALVARLGELGVRTVVAHIHPDHGASAAVAAAAGLSPTGHLHDGEVRWRLTLPEG